MSKSTQTDIKDIQDIKNVKVLKQLANNNYGIQKLYSITNTKYLFLSIILSLNVRKSFNYFINENLYFSNKLY